MNMRLFLLLGFGTLFFPPLALAQPEKQDALQGQANLPPLTQVKPLGLKDQKAKENRYPRAIVLKSEKEVRDTLDQGGTDYLLDKVDYGKQVVVVFFWAGSGKDKLTYQVAESFPEQVKFKLEAGTTLDLRHHVHPFILRKNVRWSMEIPWNCVKQEILSGQVESVFQTHKRNVTLQMKGGYQLETIEPALDDIIKMVRESGKDIPIATE